MTVPVAIARKLIAAAAKGGIQVSTQRDVRGPMLRVIAGEGQDAVVVSRCRRAGPNGQTSADGVRTVQFGIGKDAVAYYVGSTRGATTVKGTTFRGGSTVTRSGWSTIIDPTTLNPTSGKADGKLLWYWKPVPGRVGRTTNPSRALDGFDPSDFYHGHDGSKARRPDPRRIVTAAQATLIQDLAGGL